MARRAGHIALKPFKVGRVEGLEIKTENLSAAPEKPEAFMGTSAEWPVYWWLERKKIPFDFQTRLLGGRAWLGGLVVDFMVLDRDPGLVINVQGIHWHFGSSGERARDVMTKITLQNRGYDVVFVREDDVHERLDYTMKRALEGVQLYAD